MVSATVRLGYIAAVWSWTPMRSLSWAAWLAELKMLPVYELVAERQSKFRNIAQFYTEG